MRSIALKRNTRRARYSVCSTTAFGIWMKQEDADILVKSRGAGGAHLPTALTAVLAIALIGAAGWYFLIQRESEPIDGDEIGIEVGQIAPDFTLTDIDGKTFSLSDYRGKVVVIDLMATWCPPCIEQMPHLKNVHHNYGDGVMIMSIDVDPTETDEIIRQFKIRYGDEWIFASGPNVGITYEVIYIPTTYIIDRRGRIAYKSVGVTPYPTLSIEIDKLL